MNALEIVAATMKPLMNADERRLKAQFLSAFIGVHQRPKRFFNGFLGGGRFCGLLALHQGGTA